MCSSSHHTVSCHKYSRDAYRRVGWDNDVSGYRLMMRIIITVLFALFFLGMFTNHLGAGLLALAAGAFFMWADERMYRNADLLPEDYFDELAKITDDDVDPRIKS
jgi:hypothetical protein